MDYDVDKVAKTLMTVHSSLDNDFIDMLCSGASGYANIHNDLVFIFAKTKAQNRMCDINYLHNYLDVDPDDVDIENEPFYVNVDTLMHAMIENEEWVELIAAIYFETFLGVAQNEN